MKNIPGTMIGFEAYEEITRDDFDSIVLPAAIELIQRTDKLNFLLLLDAEFESFVVGAWLEEAMNKLHQMNKWNRVAVIMNTKVVKSFSDLFAHIEAGEFRGFNQNQKQAAIDWVGEKDHVDLKP